MNPAMVTQPHPLLRLLCCVAPVGQEYVVDAVSRDGQHKIVAIWAYDRRPVNGASFVCFGQRLLTMDDPCTRELVEYQKRVLTALDIVNGPSHGEVKWSGGEPVLVEVGARCHGAEGAWIPAAQGVYGYNQAQITADLYLDQQSFDRVPCLVSRYSLIIWLLLFLISIFLLLSQPLDWDLAVFCSSS